MGAWGVCACFARALPPCASACLSACARVRGQRGRGRGAWVCLRGVCVLRGTGRRSTSLEHLGSAARLVAASWLGCSARGCCLALACEEAHGRRRRWRRLALPVSPAHGVQVRGEGRMCVCARGGGWTLCLLLLPLRLRLLLPIGERLLAGACVRACGAACGMLVSRAAAAALAGVVVERVARGGWMVSRPWLVASSSVAVVVERLAAAREA